MATTGYFSTSVSCYPDSVGNASWEGYVNGITVSHRQPTPPPSRTCPYCGMSARPDWLICGEGQTWGCGAPLGGEQSDTSTTLKPHKFTYNGIPIPDMWINDDIGVLEGAAAEMGKMARRTLEKYLEGFGRAK